MPDIQINISSDERRSAIERTIVGLASMYDIVIAIGEPATNDKPTPKYGFNGESYAQTFATLAEAEAFHLGVSYGESGLLAKQKQDREKDRAGWDREIAARNDAAVDARMPTGPAPHRGVAIRLTPIGYEFDWKDWRYARFETYDDAIAYLDPMIRNQNIELTPIKPTGGNPNDPDHLLREGLDKQPGPAAPVIPPIKVVRDISTVEELEVLERKSPAPTNPHDRYSKPDPRIVDEAKSYNHNTTKLTKAEEEAVDREVNLPLERKPEPAVPRKPEPTKVADPYDRAATDEPYPTKG